MHVLRQHLKRSGCCRDWRAPSTPTSSQHFRINSARVHGVEAQPAKIYKVSAPGSARIHAFLALIPGPTVGQGYEGYSRSQRWYQHRKSWNGQNESRIIKMTTPEPTPITTVIDMPGRVQSFWPGRIAIASMKLHSDHGVLACRQWFELV